MKKLLQLSMAFLILFAIASMTSCKDDEEEEPEVLASFTFVADGLTVTFTNTSQNAATYLWDFGDLQTSTEVNPVHVYTDLGTFEVKLTAYSPKGKLHTYTNSVTCVDPDAELSKLVGTFEEGQKTWRLIRDVSTGVYPLECGPSDHSTIWWAYGLQEDLANRACMLNDEWTFVRDGNKMLFRANGDYWAEGNIYKDGFNNICANTADPMLGKNDEDLSAWGDGDHTFVLNMTATPQTLQVVGLGAYIGLCKQATGEEVVVPQDQVTYEIISLVDGTTDTLIVQGSYNDGGGYWRFVLVHYDNPNDEPPIPQPKPVPAYDMVVDGLTVTFTNTTQYGQTYLWDFGDGQTSTEQSPVHVYAAGGFFNVTMTATNSFGSASLLKPLFLVGSTPPLTADLLQGGPWKIVVAEKTIFCGSTLGNSDWWAVPMSFLTGGGTGGDDWSCMVDDEFTFSAGGVYTYDGKGLVRNDGYLVAGGQNGCVEESAVTGNGTYFLSGTHSWSLTPAAGENRALITLTNGPDRAAFLGFYKGYYGGENTNSENPPNGGNPTNIYDVMGYAQGVTYEYLFVSVDLDGAGPGTSSWSSILYR
ncbi:MAG: PKD domain-containing protein [Bacteroidales bacterium]|nr:PKD domain-containing protein [Bacteroidales bacterium]